MTVYDIDHVLNESKYYTPDTGHEIITDAEFVLFIKNTFMWYNVYICLHILKFIWLMLYHNFFVVKPYI